MSLTRAGALRVEKQEALILGNGLRERPGALESVAQGEGRVVSPGGLRRESEYQEEEGS
jgi:hypothetical protein